MPRPRARKAANLPPPHPAEWNFDKVPDMELRACALWEYARESNWIRSIKTRCEDPKIWGMGQTENMKFVGEDIERVCCDGAAAHVLARGLYAGNPCPERLPESDEWAPVPQLRPALCFPCPWQYLPAEERLRRATIPEFKDQVRAKAFDRSDWGMIEWLRDCRNVALREGWEPDPSRPGWHPGQSLFYAGEEKGIFEIGWALFTNEEICDSFARWVSKNRPSEMPGPDGRGRRDYDLRVALKRLGIMRLLHLCPLTEMDKWCPAAWQLYKRANWYKERQRAEKSFRQFLYFLPAIEEPRSWATAGSRKGG